MITSIRPTHARRGPAAAGAAPVVDAGALAHHTELARTRVAATWCVGGVVSFLALLGGLHFLEPEFAPSWRFISEYALGPFGWVMSLAFFSLAASFAALIVATRPFAQTRADRLGVACLAISAMGLIIAAIFPTDPVIAAGAATTAGTLHNVGGGLGMAMPVAAALISRMLARHSAWSWARRRLTGAAGLAVAGFVGAAAALAVLLSRSGGTFGPDVPVGWPNRLEMAGYCVWLFVTGVTLRSGAPDRR